MTKVELINEIDGKYNFAQGCVMFSYIVASVPWRQHIETFVGPCVIEIQSAKNLHGIEFTPDQILKRYEHPNAVGDDALNIVRMGLTVAIRETFEATKKFCKATAQDATLRAFPWFHFARVVRNSFSHDFRIDMSLPITKAEKEAGIAQKWLPPQTLVFSGGPVTLDVSLHGKQLDFDVLPIASALELLKMVRSSVESSLKG